MGKYWKAVLRSIAGISALVLMTPGALAAGSDIKIQNTAVRSMLMDHLFVDRGKYHVMRLSRCQFAYLESPLVVISRGRVRIRARLTGQLGMEVTGGCTGKPDATDVTVSGRPYFSGENLGLTDIRVDHVSNESYRMVLQPILEAALPRALAINLRQGVQQMIAERKSSYVVVVDRLVVTNVTAENNEINADLSFALSAK